MVVLRLEILPLYKFPVMWMLPRNTWGSQVPQLNHWALVYTQLSNIATGPGQQLAVHYEEDSNCVLYGGKLNISVRHQISENGVIVNLRCSDVLCWVIQIVVKAFAGLLRTLYSKRQTEQRVMVIHTVQSCFTVCLIFTWHTESESMTAPSLS